MPVTELIAPRNLANRVADVTALASQPVQSTPELVKLLTGVYQAILAAELDAYDTATIKPQVPKLRSELFALRYLLRGRVAQWHATGLMTHQTQMLVRDCLRAARFAADMLGELSIDCASLPEGGAPMKAFTGPINTFVTPPFDSEEGATFQAGDVLLLRGLHHNSAAIARIGDVDSQFSHVCIIHIDKTGRQWVVESLIEDGAVINTLGHALAHGNGRAMLFRHPDRKLAARAAQIAYDHVRRTYGTWKRRILYDFTMRLDQRRQLFCSKLVRFAFDRASKGQVLLPTFTTRFTMKNRDFIDRIGVKATETYAPGDTEIEPRFDLVAEWEDLRVTSRLRAQDLIMVKLFEWMELYGYTFKQDMLIRIIALLGRFSAHFSEDIKTMLSQTVPKVPINMPRKTIAAVAMLHKTAEPLLAEIRTLEAEHIARTGLPLHPRQIYAALEAIRQRSDGHIGYLVAPGA
ncbi:MAG: YiiX/YebB-like N1pC/P60 family cysteine hydrolase [Hyphomicrobiaceae bacterium]